MYINVFLLLFVCLFFVFVFPQKTTSFPGTMTIQFLAISLYLGLCYATNDIVKFSVDLEQGSSDQLRTNHSSWADAAVVTVNVQQALNTVSSHFVGVTVDSHQIRYNWNGLDFR